MTNKGNGGKKKGRHQVDLDKVFADGRAIDRAMRAGVAAALRERRRRGLPIVEWSFEENRVVWTTSQPESHPHQAKRASKKARPMK